MQSDPRPLVLRPDKIRLLNEFYFSLEALSALVFRVAGRNPAVNVIWLAKQMSHVFFASRIVGRILVPPFLLNKLVLLDFPFAYELLDYFCICKILVLQTLLPSALICLYAAPVLLETVPPLMSPEKKPHRLSLMHQSTSKSLPGGKLLTSHLIDLGLILTSITPLYKVDLELLCCCNLCSNRVCGFVVSAGTSCTDRALASQKICFYLLQ